MHVMEEFRWVSLFRVVQHLGLLLALCSLRFLSLFFFEICNAAALWLSEHCAVLYGT